MGFTFVSNPAIAEVAGGLLNEAAGTEPTGWRTITWTATTYNPTIERTVQPVIKLRKSVSTTDTVMVDLAGVVVEYELGTEYTDTGAGSATGSGGGEDALAGDDTAAGTAKGSGASTDAAAGDDLAEGSATASGTATSSTAGDGPTYRSVVLEDDPVLYWRLNESGNLEVEDRSGNERKGEYRNEAGLGAPGALEGDPDTSVALDEAKAGYVKGLTYDPFSGTKTFELWAKRTSAHEKEDVLFSGTNGGTAGVFAYIKEGTDNIRLTLNGFGTTATWEHAWPADEAWVHLVFVVDPSALKATLYVNGVSKGEKTISAYGGTAGNVRISHDNAVGALKGAFPGWLDEFAIYEGPLSAERVQAHYEAGSRAPAPPASRCLFGAIMDGDVALVEGEAKVRGDAPYDATTWNRFEEHAGRAVDTISYSDPWTGAGLVWDGFQKGITDAVRARGAIPMKSLGGPANVLADVAAGKYDASIKAWAEAAAAFGDTVFARLWWEFNQSASVWSWSGTGRTAEHLAAWRHFVDLVRPIAPNVLYVWCPNVTAGGPADPEPWYPGDDYVDWTGMDGYSGTNPAKSFGWRSAYKLFKPTYDRLLEIAPGKPIAICEVAASEFGGSKATWTRNLLGEMVQEEMPQVRGFYWFNWNIDHGAGRVDWPIETSPEAQAAFKAGISSSYYGNPLYVKVEAATLPVSSQAVLRGQVDPGGLPARWWFEWGETSAYGKKTAVVSASGLAEPAEVRLKSLRPRKTYHFRLVAENELGEVTTADVAFTLPAAPAPRVMAEPVDDTIFIETRTPDGSPTRWSGRETDAGNIAQQIKSSTSAPGGHRDFSTTLLRDPRRDWPDLNLVDELVAYGRVKPLGRNLFQGMTAQFPAQLGDGYSIGVNAVGHQELLNEDETWRALYVKPGFDGWGDAPLWRRREIASGGFTQGKIQAGASAGGLTWDVPAEGLPNNEHAEQWWEAPAGVKVSKLGYRGKLTGDTGRFESPSLQGVDSETTANGPDREIVPLTLDDTARTADLPEPRRRLMLRMRSIAEGTPSSVTQQSFSQLAEYGATGVPLRDIAGQLPGVYFHDALAHILSTGAPDLSYSVRADGTIVPNTSFVLADFAPMNPGKPTEAIEKGNAYFLNNWAVWDEKRFWWHPWDPTRLTWNANLAGGAQWTPVGRQAFSLINGIVVSYTDAYGVARLAGPPGSGCDYEDSSLADPDPNNPYTRRGRRRWAKLEVGFPLAFPTQAFQIGAVVLAESRVPQRSGTLVLRPRGAGHIPAVTHPTIGALPVWALRAGDFMRLMDWPEPEPFRIIETDYDHESKTLTAQLDSGAARLGAILERTGSRLTFV